MRGFPRVAIAAAFAAALFSFAPARAQNFYGGGGGIPYPVVNGDCIIGSNGVPVWSACAGGAAVASVVNSDGTLTISPTTGSVIASLALGHANTWTGQQSFVAPILGTPASGVATNLTGTAASLTAGHVTTNANLTGPITSTGNATAIANGAIGLAKLGNEVDGDCVVGTSGAWAAGSCGGGSATGVGVQGGQSPSTTNMGDTGTIGTPVALSAAKFVYATTGSYSAARYKTLPDSATQGAGDIEILDAVGTLTATNTINICPAGSDTINGVNSCLAGIGVPYASLRIHNDGAGAWTTAGGATIPAFTASTHNFVTGISAGGVWAQAQPAIGDISGLGTGIATALGINVGSAGAPVTFNGAGGTPSSITLTNATGYPAATTSAAGIAKLHNVPLSVGWLATVNPNGATIAVINQASTISAIIGDVEIATGGTATVSVYEAASGTACGSGTVLHSGSFDANGTAATNQTLTLTTTTIAAGSRLCIVTTGTTTWTGGTGVGGITVFLSPT